jgi:hypothetical protein
MTSEIASDWQWDVSPLRQLVGADQNSSRPVTSMMAQGVGSDETAAQDAAAPTISDAVAPVVEKGEPKGETKPPASTQTETENVEVTRHRGWNKKYATPAERQAAYRLRKTAAADSEFAVAAESATVEEAGIVKESRIEAQQSVIAVESASVATVADVVAGALAAEPVAPIESPLERDRREAAEAAAIQHEQDTQPVNWDDETRTDLPQRTRGRICYLLQFEAAESDRRGLPLDRFTGAPALTVRRIQNDIVRRAYGGGGGHLRANPEAFQVRGGSDGNRHSSW